MTFLADPDTAALYAVGVFLVTLGVLVVFVETVRLARFVTVVVVSFVVALLLALVGESGMALLMLGFGGAFITNHVFEWLTTR